MTARKVAHLDKGVVHGAVAVHRDHDGRRSVAAHAVHALIKRAGYPAAVDRKAEEQKLVRVVAEVIAKGRDIQRVRLELSGDHLRHLFRAARRAEI